MSARIPRANVERVQRACRNHMTPRTHARHKYVTGYFCDRTTANLMLTFRYDCDMTDYVDITRK